MLRRKVGDDWYKIFGFTGSIPKKLKLLVACAMPFDSNTNNSFANQIIKIENDELHLHYIYFQVGENQVENISSSLPGIKVKI